MNISPCLRKISWATMLLLLGVTLALAILSLPPELIERFYTHFLYAYLTRILTRFTSSFACSLSELALYASLLAGLGLCAVAGIRRSGRLLAFGLVRGIAVAVVWFYLAWGCNYFRMPLDQQLHLPAARQAADSLALRQGVLWSIQRANATWRAVPRWDLPKLDATIEKGYRAVCDTLQIALMPGRRRPKFLLFPGLFNFTLTSGMFGPFFHEVHLNAELLPVELPFVLAHEKAHQMGFAREAEASFLAALVCTMSADSAVQYSGYFSVLGSFWARASRFGDRDSLRQNIRPEVRADFAAVRKRYEKYEGTVSEISQKSYDAYLRANRVEGGLKSYNDVVDLLMRWRAQRAALKFSRHGSIAHESNLPAIR